ncbi:MAG TPA: hypothetical protein VFV54_10550, partial [Thermoanaerobaculia bacterium]|nr:hypothetical protein [Thermoanaerobaculia bacterium]
DGLVGPIAAIGEKHVYVATIVRNQASLDVYEVSDLGRPALVKSVQFFNFAQELIPRGSLLYAPDEYGIQVFDIADPASPALKGTMKLEPDNPLTVAASSVALYDQYAFVSAEDGLRVVDVSDPAKMRVVGSWSGNAVSQLAYSDGYLYATTGAFGAALVVFDVSDPRQPVPIGSVSLEGRSVGELLLDGPYAYVANGGAGVAVIDIRSAAHPVVVQKIAVPGFASQLALDRGRLLITASNGGLLIAEQAGQAPMAASVSSSRLHAPTPRHPGTVADEIPRPLPPSSRRTPPPLSANAGRSVIVTSAADSGAGTLREALANHDAGDVITFDPAAFPPSAPATIQPLTVLPRIKRDGVVIDASNAGVILDGSRLSGAFESGLEIEDPSKGNIIRGLQIVNFPSCGIFVGGDGDNIIGGDRSRGTGPIGEGNLLSRNFKAGIQVADPNGNRIVGNLIGTDLTGRTVLGGQTVGVNIFFNTGEARSAGVTPSAATSRGNETSSPETRRRRSGSTSAAVTR